MLFSSFVSLTEGELKPILVSMIDFHFQWWAHNFPPTKIVQLFKNVWLISDWQGNLGEKSWHFLLSLIFLVLSDPNPLHISCQLKPSCTWWDWKVFITSFCLRKSLRSIFLYIQTIYTLFFIKASQLLEQVFKSISGQLKKYSEREISKFFLVFFLIQKSWSRKSWYVAKQKLIILERDFFVWAK